MTNLPTIIASALLLVVSALAFVTQVSMYITTDNIDSFYWVSVCYGTLATLLSLAIAVNTCAGPRGNLSPPSTLTSLICVLLFLPTVGFSIGLLINKSSIISIAQSHNQFDGAQITLQGHNFAILEGLIGKATLPSLQALVSENNIKFLELRSGGGLIDPAIQLADYLRVEKISSVNYTHCESACVIVALGGKSLYASPKSVFGFHQGSSIASRDSQLGRLTGKIGTDVLFSALKDRGVPLKILEKAMKTPSKEMYYLTGIEMFDLGLVKRLIKSD
jgi:ATP-dependent protease ClpP protease subunit